MPRIQRGNLRALGLKLRKRKPTRVVGTLAVLGDAQIREPRAHRGLAHLLKRAGAVGGLGVIVKRTAELLACDELLAWLPFHHEHGVRMTRLRRHEVEPKRLVHIRGTREGLVEVHAMRSRTHPQRRKMRLIARAQNFIEAKALRLRAMHPNIRAAHAVFRLSQTRERRVHVRRIGACQKLHSVDDLLAHRERTHDGHAGHTARCQRIGNQARNCLRCIAEHASFASSKLCGAREDIRLRLLAKSAQAHEAVLFAGLLKLTERLDAKALMQRANLRRPKALDRAHLKETRRHLPFERCEALRLRPLQHRIDHREARGAEASNTRQRSRGACLSEVSFELKDSTRSGSIGARPWCWPLENLKCEGEALKSILDGTPVATWAQA